MSTPTATVRAKILEVLTAAALNIELYDSMEHMGFTYPCLVMDQTEGTTERYPIQDELYAASTKGHTVRLWFRFYVYATSKQDRDTHGDAAIHAIWDARGDFEEDGIWLEPATGIRDIVALARGARLYGKTFSYSFETDMTAAL